MDVTFAILIVCSANVCRSPFAQGLLERWAVESGRAREVSVRSAGVAAFPGDPMCPQSATLLEVDPFDHAARELSPGMLIDADLVLTADRTQRGAAARLAPSCRRRLFTLRQASALASALTPPLLSGALPEGAPPLPDTDVARLEWLTRELNEARGLLAGQPAEDDDILDRHGPAPHPDSFDEVASAVDALTTAFDACLRTP